MKGFNKLALIVIFHLIVMLTFSEFSSGFTPVDYGKWWKNLNDVEKLYYIYGLIDGYHKANEDIYYVNENKNEADFIFKRIHEKVPILSDVYKIKDWNIVHKVASDIYKDPANTYIEPISVINIAIEKLQGKSIEEKLKQERAFPWKVKEIMDRLPKKKKIEE